MTTTTEKINEHYDVTSGGYFLHVTGESNDVEVWFNMSMEYDGIAIGGGETRAEAVADAIETLERALGVLRERR